MNRLFSLFLLFSFFSSCQSKIPVINVCSEKAILFTHKHACLITLNEDCISSNKLKASVKYRGGSSVKFAKKSYTVEFDKKITFGGIEKDDDWILNASYIDKTFMRHKISFELFQEMHGNNKAAKCTYVEVQENDIPMGLYIAMEEVNAANLGLNKKDTLAMLFKDPPLFFEEKIIPQDSSNYYQQKFPKITTKDQSQYLQDFKSFLFYSSDSLFSSNVSDWVDVNNMVDWHLLLLLSNNSDGILKNFYWYKLDSSTPFRVAVWDYDHSFGRDGDNEYNMMDRELDCSRSILFKRLLALDSYRAALSWRWKELRQNGILTKANFNKKIAANTKVLKSYLKQNEELWPLNSEDYYDENSFKEEVDIMKAFFDLRLEQLDARFN